MNQAKWHKQNGISDKHLHRKQKENKTRKKQCDLVFIIYSKRNTNIKRISELFKSGYNRSHSLLPNSDRMIDAKALKKILGEFRNIGRSLS